MTNRKKVSLTIYLSEEQDAALRELAKRTRVPASAYVREGVEHVLSLYNTSEKEPTE